MSRFLRPSYLWFTATLLVVLFANVWGLWWVTFVVGLVSGVMAPLRRELWCAIGGAVVGWVVPLVLLGHSLWRASIDISSLMGYGFRPTAIILTIAIGSLLVKTGAWLGRALRAISRHDR